MIRYVKVCANGHINDEYHDVCGECSEFLGAISAKPYSAPQPAISAATAPASEQSAPAEPAPVTSALQFPVTQRMDAPAALVLEIPGTTQSYTLRHGWIIGQAHSSRPAHLQIADVPGVECIHRHHCKVEQRGSEWFALPIDQRQFGKDWTSPTFINGVLVLPGSAHPLRNGDRLTLAGVQFIVRVF